MLYRGNRVSGSARTRSVGGSWRSQVFITSKNSDYVFPCSCRITQHKCPDIPEVHVGQQLRKVYPPTWYPETGGHGGVDGETWKGDWTAQRREGCFPLTWVIAWLCGCNDRILVLQTRAREGRVQVAILWELDVSIDFGTIRSSWSVWRICPGL